MLSAKEVIAMNVAECDAVDDCIITLRGVADILLAMSAAPDSSAPESLDVLHSVLYEAADKLDALER